MHVKKQENMTQSKEQNESPEKNCKKSRNYLTVNSE